MTEQRSLTDYYQVLQISRTCDQKDLEAAYRRLAKLFHPDNAETGDDPKFRELVEAYTILRDTDYRREYDMLLNDNMEAEGARSSDYDKVIIKQNNVLTDVEAHEKVLLTLYKKRRANPQTPGVLAFYINQILNCSDELFEFHIWYLKAKGFIERTEQNELAITFKGIDHVISASRSRVATKLLIHNANVSPTDHSLNIG